MSESRTCDVQGAAPSVLDKVVGQRAAVELLRVGLAAYWNDRAAGRSPSFGPVLLEGPSGCGKTLLGKVVAAELGATLREALGQSFGACDSINAFLLDASDDMVLFIDEAHLMSDLAQTAILRALEDRVLLLPHGSSSGRSTTIPLSGFTTILATTNPEGLVAPLRDRMRLVLQFDYYTPEELTALCRQRAQALRWQVEEEVLALIAGCAKQTPRMALRLLQSCYRTSRAEDANAISVAHFRRTLRLEGLDPEMGLDRVEQSYLRALFAAEARPLRLHLLAARLGLPPKTLSDVTERFLVREGLVDRTDAGRELTRKGREYVQRQRQRQETGDARQNL